jgi:hypothetical protein
MTRGLLFWVVYVICVIVWLGVSFGGFGGPYGAHLAGGSVIEFILFGLLGWQVFGPVVHG